MGQSKTVLTLDPETLENLLVKLWTVYCETRSAPDAIVGIAYGGSVCAKILARRVGVPVFAVSLRRPGTARKQKFGAKVILPVLPYAVTNWLRRWEDASRKTDPTPPGPDNLPAHLVKDVSSIADQVQQANLNHLLVLDDALDSGVTLWCVREALRQAFGDTVTVGSAVIVQTGDRVAAEADVALYRQILCRFPWSYDYR